MLVLASQSLRRQQILRTAGIDFIVRVPGVPEEIQPSETPEAYVRRLALAKANAVSANDNDIVLAADTVVVVDEHILEKPSDFADATRMLQLLAGRCHEVVTGICLKRAAETIVDTASTLVHFAPMNPQEIDDYVTSGEPMDKAGGYAIQGRASKFIDRIEGDYFNVVGLPIALVYRYLKEFSSLPR